MSVVRRITKAIKAHAICVRSEYEYALFEYYERQGLLPRARRRVARGRVLDDGCGGEACRCSRGSPQGSESTGRARRGRGLGSARARNTQLTSTRGGIGCSRSA